MILMGHGPDYGRWRFAYFDTPRSLMMIIFGQAEYYHLLHAGSCRSRFGMARAFRIPLNGAVA